MDQALSLLATLNLALKQLEAAGLQAGPDSEDARPALRKLIELFQDTEGAHAGDLLSSLEDILLDRMGILVAAHVSAANVRTILRNKGFGNLADEHSNRDILSFIVEAREVEYRDICKMQERFELVAARDLVENAGLNWSEDKET
jgi:hypothetical protein